MARAKALLVEGLLRPYVEFGAGRAFVQTQFDDAAAKSYSAWAFRGALGLEIRPMQELGLTMAAGRLDARVLENLLGDRHQSGGFYLNLGAVGAL